MCPDLMGQNSTAHARSVSQQKERHIYHSTVLGTVLNISGTVEQHVRISSTVEQRLLRKGGHATHSVTVKMQHSGSLLPKITATGDFLLY